MFQNRVLRKVFGAWRVQVRGNGENCLMRSFMFLLVNRCHSGDEIKENEMGRECGTCAGEKKNAYSGQQRKETICKT
jgi:hypothetical protein